MSPTDIQRCVDCRHRRPHRPILISIALASLLWVLLPGIASAHAHLVQANPAPAAIIARVPHVASFLFDEPLNPTLTRVRIVDAAGHMISTTRGYLATGHDNELWQLPLPRLSGGTYSVFWTSESATDGHVMSSFYTFQVAATGTSSAMRAVSGAAGGAMGGASASGADTLVAISTAAGTTALFIWLGQMAQALWLGALIVELVVLARSRRSTTLAESELAHAATRRVWMLGSAALVSVLASLAGQVICLAVQGTGGDWAQALAPATLLGMLSSQNGQILIARFVMLAGALILSRQVVVPSFAPSRAILSWPDRPATRPMRAAGIVAPAFRPQWESTRIVLLVLAGVYMLLVALSGHAADVSPVWLSAGIDWVHLVCTAAWVGGMAALAYGVLPFRSTLNPEDRAPAVLGVLDRFSPVAYFAVGALALSGLFAALSHLHTPSAVVGTTYGHLLTLKSGLVGLLIVLSASHVRIVRPLIARAQRQLASHTRSVATVHEGLATLAGRIRLEVAIGALVLLITALMSQTLPATTASATGAHAASTAHASVTGTAVTGDLRAALTIAPPAVGMTTFTVRIWEAGKPVTADTGAVLLHLYPTAQPDMRANLAPVGNASRFTVRGSLAMAGSWSADVLVRTVAVNDYRLLHFAFTVGSGARFVGPMAAAHSRTDHAQMNGDMAGM